MVVLGVDMRAKNERRDGGIRAETAPAQEAELARGASTGKGGRAGMSRPCRRCPEVFGCSAFVLIEAIVIPKWMAGTSADSCQSSGLWPAICCLVTRR